MTKTLGNIKIVIADDHEIFRDGFRLMISRQDDIQLLGEAGDGRELIDLVQTLKPDVVITDIKMPRMDGIEATRLIKEEWPSVLVIGLSVHSAPQVGDTMREAGAFSVLTKEAAVDDLHRTIQQALNSHPGGGGRTGRQETGDAGAALR